jgi:hypothetical protein
MVVKDKAVPSTQKGWAFGKRRQAKPEGIYGIGIESLKEQLHPRSERKSSRIFGKTVGLEVMKRAVGISNRMRKMSE